MTSRIVYCLLSLAVEHMQLVKVDNYMVAAMEDDVVLQAVAADPTARLIYYSRKQYDLAIEGLEDEQVQEAIKLRHKEFAENPLVDGMSRLFQLERGALTLSAVVNDGMKGQESGPISRHIEAKLGAMAHTRAQGRYDDVDLAYVLVVLLEGEALLLAELQGDGAPLAVTGETENRLGFTKPIAESLRVRGRSEYAEALPFAEPWRSIFVRPADESLISALRVEMRPFVEWQGGVVASWPIRQLSGLRQGGKKATVLYSGAEDRDQNGSMTEAQLHRRFARSLEADESSLRRNFTVYLNALRLEQALLRRTVLEHAQSGDAHIASYLKQQIVTETAMLVRALIRDQSWLLGVDLCDGEELRRQEARIAAEAGFLAKLAGAFGQPELAARFSEVKARKQRDIQRLYGG